MSIFQERPRFYQSQEKAIKIGYDGNNLDNSDNAIKNRQENSRVLLDLIRLIPNDSEKNRFRKKTVDQK